MEGKEEKGILLYIPMAITLGKGLQKNSPK